MANTAIPSVQDIKNIQFPDYDVDTLAHGIPIIVLGSDDPPIIRMECLIKAGRYYEEKQMVARSAAGLLLEGTSQYTSAELAEKIEWLGASVRCKAGMDFTRLSMYVLERNAAELLTIWEHVLEEAHYPQSELDKYKRRSIESLRMDLSNNEIVAHREFTRILYGSHHPYGYNRDETIISNLHREDLVNHADLYSSGLHSFYVSGAVGQSFLDQLNTIVERHIPKEPSVSNPTVDRGEESLVRIKNGKSVQASIRLGRVLPKLHVEDRFALNVLNTALGGYFGSRLITRIREELGYTYGVYSTIDQYHRSACWYVSTEVGSEYVEDTIKEIRLAMKRLCEEPISTEEFRTLKNYLMGTVLMSFNGRDRTLSTLAKIHSQGRTLFHARRFVRFVQRMTPEHIQKIAQQFFVEEEMNTVIVL